MTRPIPADRRRDRRRGQHTENQIGAAPSERDNEERCERRHDERANANPADCKTGRKAAAPDEPPLHGAQRGNVGAADAEPNAKPVGRVDLQQATRRACDHEADPG